MKFKRVLPAIIGITSLSVVAISPIIASAAQDGDNTTVTATVDPTITLTTGGSVGISLAPAGSAVVSSESDTVTVSTNNALGYNLAIKDADANLNLVNGGQTLAAHSGTAASPTTLATNTWGYRVDGEAGFGVGPTTAEDNNTTSTTTWAGITATDVEIKSTSSTAQNDTTTVWFGVKMDNSKPAGSYSDIVTYTATTNT